VLAVTGVLFLSLYNPADADAQLRPVVRVKAESLLPFGNAPIKSSSLSVTAKGDVICQQCEEACVIFMGQSTCEHRFIGECGNSFAALTRPTTAAKILNVANYAPTAFLAGGGGCKRCGGTSDCHGDWDGGECHIQCGPGGGEDLAIAIAALVKKHHYQLLVELVSQSPAQVTINAQRSAIQITGCNGELIAHFPVPHATSHILASVQSKAAAATMGVTSF